MGKHSAPSRWSTGFSTGTTAWDDPDLQLTTEFDVQELPRDANFVTGCDTQEFSTVNIHEPFADAPSTIDFSIDDLDIDDPEPTAATEQTDSPSPESRASRAARRSRKPILMATVPLGVLAAAATVGAGAPTDQNATAAPDTAATDTHVRPVASTGEPDPDLPSGRRLPMQANAAPVAAEVLPAFPASVLSGAVPKQAFGAYQRAAETVSRTNPGCGMTWNTVAGIGRVESHHANNGNIDPTTGNLRSPIYGPTLNGTLAGNEVITDTDGGRLDGDAVHDRAVGPMQFLPSTWEKYSADANGDGKADPQNIYDAALTTAKYLCDGNLDMRKPADQIRAILRYNNSMTYVDNVLGFARGY